MKTITIEQDHFIPDTPEEIAWKIEQVRKLKGTCRLLTPEERRKVEKKYKGLSQSELFRLFGLD